MATVYQDYDLDLKGRTLVVDSGLKVGSAGSIASGSAFYAGRGLIMLQVLITVIEVASNDELYNISQRVNTRAASTTWVDTGVSVCVGATEVTGRDADDSASSPGEVIFGVYNAQDYQMKFMHYMEGAVATGINYYAYAIPGNQFPIS